MDQKSFLAITAMLNGFPQGQATNSELLLRTYEAALADVSGQAIVEAAQRFTTGQVAGQSKTFAPSIAEFVSEARRIAEMIPYRNRGRIEPPSSSRFFRHDDDITRIRMGFKMSLLSAAIGMKRVDDVAQANREGMDSLMALAQQWSIPIPEELWTKRAA